MGMDRDTGERTRGNNERRSHREGRNSETIQEMGAHRKRDGEEPGRGRVRKSAGLQ